VVFSSHIFVFYFLPLALLCYYAAPRVAKHLVLTLLSYVFYGWWNPWFTLLMLFSTVIDYLCGKVITAPGASRARRQTGLWSSVVVNLTLLGFFKYAGFGAATASGVAELFGGSTVAVPAFLGEVVLPVGISFYTFQSMSYSIDLYRGHAVPARSFVDFCCYVSMFPQLVAGPIVRYGSVAEQLRHREHTVGGFAAGLSRFNLGFAKKIFLANPMGGVADLAFAAGDGVLTAPVAWFGVAGYAFQIYFDFSAYSDMAIGLGRMFGFQFPENFNSPYKSRSLTEFWRRWHISLSSFLRDYLYIPLGGNRLGAGRTYVNLMTVMVIGGLWHGASWNFVVWGAIHGAVLAAERVLGRETAYAMLPAPVRVAVTFVVVLVTWVFFRAENFDVAWRFLGAMFGAGGGAAATPVLGALVFTPLNVVMFVVCTGVAFLAPRTTEILEVLTPAKAFGSVALLVGGLCVMFWQGFNPFLYFAF
jgi:alginate O-acetyltransferase complex protein AlgI